MNKGLSYEDLRELTRGRTKAEVIAILESNGISPQIGKGGKPFLLPPEYTQQPATKEPKPEIEV